MRNHFQGSRESKDSTLIIQAINNLSASENSFKVKERISRDQRTTHPFSPETILGRIKQKGHASHH